MEKWRLKGKADQMAILKPDDVPVNWTTSEVGRLVTNVSHRDRVRKSGGIKIKALKQLVNKNAISMSIGLILISTNGFASDYCQEQAKKDRAYISGLRADYDALYPEWSEEKKDLEYRKAYAEFDATIRYNYESCRAEEDKWKDPVYMKRLKEQGSQNEKELYALGQIARGKSKQDES